MIHQLYIILKIKAIITHTNGAELSSRAVPGGGLQPLPGTDLTRVTLGHSVGAFWAVVALLTLLPCTHYFSNENKGEFFKRIVDNRIM